MHLRMGSALMLPPLSRERGSMSGCQRYASASHWEGSAFASSPVSPAGSAGAGPSSNPRSQEHTSELQSLMRTSYAVFCFNKNNNVTTYPHKDSEQHA